MPFSGDMSLRNDIPNLKTERPAKPLFRRLSLLLCTIVALGAMAPVPGNAASQTPAAGPTAAPVRSVNAPLSDAGWTSSRFPTTPQNAKPYLSLTNTSDTTYLRFDVSGIPAGASIVSANLKLTTASTSSTSPGFTVYSANNAWDPATLVESKKPAMSATQMHGNLQKATVGTQSSIPLTGLTIEANAKSISLAVKYNQRYVSTTVAKSGAGKPALTIVYSVMASSTTPPVTTTPVAPPAAAKPPADDKMVFAHYFPPYPISLDNQPGATDYYARNYLTVGGESGKHSAYGGLLRDRPLPRQPLTGDYQLADLSTEVGQAANSGIDGFTVDVLSFSGRNWDITTKLMKAAAQSKKPFVVTPNLDMTSSSGKSSVSVIAGKLAELYKTGGSYRLADGSYVLSSFKAEAQTPAWWKSLIATMQNTYGYKVKLIAVFLDSGSANMAAYAPISYALGDWGSRNADGAIARPNRAAAAHALGVKWMAGVGAQDVRPNQGLYAEANNTETFRTNWSRAISDGADLVQLVTWNDYSEGTSIAPSVAHGSTLLDISSYYSAQFKTKVAPKITADTVFLTHRIQRTGTSFADQSLLMKPTLGGSKTTPRDTVEVLSRLTAAADITVNVGPKSYTYQAPAGVSSKAFPLGGGAISAVATRAAKTVISLKSPFQLTDKPVRQDLQYYGVEAHN